jgi:hypothetical protein
MKTSTGGKNFMIKKNNFVHSLLIMIIVLPAFLMADKVCNFKLQNCPENFNGKTIYVPEYVYSIAPDFKVCIPLTTIQNNSGTPPSIVFIIDNSPSMRGSSQDRSLGLDIDGSRFQVTKALLDTINKTFPDAEVGLVVFDNKLFFNSDDDSMFKRMPADFNVPDDVREQAYVPLMQLNKKQKNGMSGIEYLKYILQVEKTPLSGSRLTTDLVYQPSGWDFEDHGGTHINIAFDAAKEAMKSSSFAKENQYIIFFSDGDANQTTSPKRVDYFSEGENVPTTFTVYFTESATGSAPRSLQTMTRNIQSNNYSSSNPSSQLWTIQTNFDALMNLAMKNIFNPLILNIKQKPTTLIINNKTYTTVIDSSTFNLGESLKLNDSLTRFDISVKYSVKDDSLKIQKDTSLSISFNVIRSDQHAMSEGITLDCSDTTYYTISMQATDAVAKEKDANTGTITLSRNNTIGSVTVYFLKEGTATYKDDYTISALDSVTFKDGEKSITVTITPIEDTIIDEPTETVILTLLDKFNSREIRYSINKNQSTATVTIENWIDFADTTHYTISMQATDAIAKEKDSSTGTITLTRNITIGSVTVYFSREGSATYNSDYSISALDSVTFKDGEKSVTVTITPVNDTIIEENENVTLTLLDNYNSREIRYYINKNQSTASVTIEDSYVPPPDTLTIHITPNPFTPNNSKGFSEKIKTMFSNVINNNNNGMLIAVRSTAKLEKTPGTTDEYGTGYIYDAVGNLVNIIKMKKANNSSTDSTNYGFLWDCKNRNQRMVGLGTYLIKIRFKEANGQERVFTRKMGVKK